MREEIFDAELPGTEKKWGRQFKEWCGICFIFSPVTVGQEKDRTVSQRLTLILATGSSLQGIGEAMQPRPGARMCVCVCVCVCVPAQWLSHFRLLGTPQTAAFQARVLKWVAMPSFRGSSWCRDQTLSRVSLALQVDSLSLCGSSLSPRAMVMLPGGAALWIKAVADRPGWGGGCGMHKTREIVPYLRIVEKRKEFPGWGWGRTLRSCSLGDGI